MRNKSLKRLLLCLVGILFVSLTMRGQEEPKASFPDGTTVILENKVGSKSSENRSLKVKAINILSSFGGVNTVHRVFVDRESKVHFGYDLQVKKETEKGKFTITFKPLSVRLFVSDSEATTLKYPEPFQINEGDAISIDLLENPKTKEKIADIIKVILSEPNPQNMVIGPGMIPNIMTGGTTTRIYSSESSGAPKDLTIDEIRMQLVNSNLFVNEKQTLEKKTFAGANLYFYLKGKGRFILSPFPRTGFNFQKIGLIDGNKISFSLNGDKYEINSLLPIFCSGGKWNLWVLYDPNYRPNSEDVTEEMGIERLDKK